MIPWTHRRIVRDATALLILAVRMAAWAFIAFATYIMIVRIVDR